VPVMMITNGGSTKRFGLARPAVSFVLGAWPAIAPGQPWAPTEACHPLGNAAIVRAAREQIAGGESIASVTNALSCVARNHHGYSRTNTKAVRVGFAIQESDAGARLFLLGIIRDAWAPGLVRELACELLTYVADADAEAAIFDIFSNSWASQPAPTYFGNLRSLASTRFLTWLDMRLELRDHAPVPRVMLESEVELIRAQQNPSRVLQYITSSENPTLFRKWLALHALRCGVTRTELREALLPVFESAATTGPEYYAQLMLVESLDELRVFGEKDNALLKPLRDTLGRAVTCYGDEGPVWAERIIAAKRAAFLRAPRGQGDAQ